MTLVTTSSGPRVRWSAGRATSSTMTRSIPPGGETCRPSRSTRSRCALDSLSGLSASICGSASAAQVPSNGLRSVAQPQSMCMPEPGTPGHPISALLGISTPMTTTGNGCGGTFPYRRTSFSSTFRTPRSARFLARRSAGCASMARLVTASSRASSPRSGTGSTETREAWSRGPGPRSRHERRRALLPPIDHFAETDADSLGNPHSDGNGHRVADGSVPQRWSRAQVGRDSRQGCGCSEVEFELLVLAEVDTSIAVAIDVHRKVQRVVSIAQGLVWGSKRRET